jgi:hypothetical protein
MYHIAAKCFVPQWNNKVEVSAFFDLENVGKKKIPRVCIFDKSRICVFLALC